MLMLLSLFLVAEPGGAVESATDLEVFLRAGCPRCEAAKIFLRDLQDRRPDLRILMQDIGENPTALARLEELARKRSMQAIGVPAFYLRDELIVGFQDAQTTGSRLIAPLESMHATTEPESFAACRPIRQDCDDLHPRPSAAEDSLLLPWFGRITLRDVGLPLFTLAIGLLDGFNPCAMWVLLFLLSLLVTLRDRLKMSLVLAWLAVVLTRGGRTPAISETYGHPIGPR